MSEDLRYCPCGRAAIVDPDRDARITCGDCGATTHVDELLRRPPTDHEPMTIYTPRMARAIQVASLAHLGQYYGRWSYIWHPLAVMSALLDVDHDEDVVIAGVLHDVVEDSFVTIEDLRADFGDRVADIVAGVTKKDGEDYETFIQRAASNRDSRSVKIADVICNLYAPECPPRLRAKYENALTILLKASP